MENEQKKMEQKWKSVGYNTIYSEKNRHYHFKFQKKAPFLKMGNGVFRQNYFPIEQLCSCRNGEKSKGEKGEKGAKDWEEFRVSEKIRMREKKNVKEREQRKRNEGEWGNQTGKWVLKHGTCHVLVCPGVLCWLVEVLLLLVLNLFIYFFKIFWRGHVFKLTLRVLSICIMYRL